MSARIRYEFIDHNLSNGLSQILAPKEQDSKGRGLRTINPGTLSRHTGRSLGILAPKVQDSRPWAQTSTCTPK